MGPGAPRPPPSRAGKELPLDGLSHTRLACCFYSALACATVYVLWLLRVTVQGYRHLFRKLARRKPFKGAALIRMHGLGVFQAEWSTYSSGALIGNALLAVVSITALLTNIFLLLSLESFWSFVFSFWRAGGFGVIRSSVCHAAIYFHGLHS
ncbi:unnamed protein product [Prorocentrum cordatum]|uniref:Uncharacterized protein n=1 Tax=Prorocentrum cordatum TaxID=2364126 RepID=A0ABN9QFY4_9DINO|nr:unnamed protein product [Polarella glacialis]